MNYIQPFHEVSTYLINSKILPRQNDVLVDVLTIRVWQVLLTCFLLNMVMLDNCSIDISIPDADLYTTCLCMSMGFLFFFLSLVSLFSDIVNDLEDVRVNKSGAERYFKEIRKKSVIL